ncbi:MAG TPA: ABC transporter substrate-binding protein [Myxococcales bacterium]
MRRLAIVLVLSLATSIAWAGSRARYGGELRLVSSSLPASMDPAQLATPIEVAVARQVFATLLSVDADGTLVPELAVAVPEPEAAGKLFRIRLRPGLKFHDGNPLTAQDVVASLARLDDPATGSPFAALALPLVGATEPGRASGLSATGELELQASLAFSYPDWPRALAHPAAAPLPGGKFNGRPIGAGPLLLSGSPSGAELRLQAFPECAAGRAFVDTVRLSVADARSAARAFSLGEADVVLGTADKKAAEGPALFATYLAVNTRRLGAKAPAVRQAVEASVDVADLAKFFVRGATPLHGLLPSALESAATAAAKRPARPTLPAGLQLVLLCDESADEQRAVADRLQVKLHDFGVAVQVRRLPRAAYREALGSGAYDLALTGFALLPEPGMALAQLVAFAQGRDAARELLKVVGAGSDLAARRAAATSQATALRAKLDLLPLYVQVPRVLVRPGVVPVAVDGCGAPLLSDAWFEARPSPK